MVQPRWGHILSRLGMGLCTSPAGRGGASGQAGGQQASADLLLLNMSLTAGDPMLQTWKTQVQPGAGAQSLLFLTCCCSSLQHLS